MKVGNGGRKTENGQTASITRQSQPEKKQQKATALVTRQCQPEEEQQKTTLPATRQNQPEETQEKTSPPLTGQGQECEVLRSSWDVILLYPKQIPFKKTKAGTSDFPAHISSEQMIEYLRQKEEKLWLKKRQREKEKREGGS